MRAFSRTHLDRDLSRRGPVLAVIVDNVEFGLGRTYQGTAGAVQAGLTGLMLAVMIHHRGRMADALVTHAGYGLVGLAAAYALRARHT